MSLNSPSPINFSTIDPKSITQKSYYESTRDHFQNYKEVAGENFQHYKAVAGENLQHYKAVAGKNFQHYKAVAGEYQATAAQVAGEYQEKASQMAGEYRGRAVQWVKDNPDLTRRVAVGATVTLAATAGAGLGLFLLSGSSDSQNTLPHQEGPIDPRFDEVVKFFKKTDSTSIQICPREQISLLEEPTCPAETEVKPLPTDSDKPHQNLSHQEEPIDPRFDEVVKFFKSIDSTSSQTCPREQICLLEQPTCPAETEVNSPLNESDKPDQEDPTSSPASSNTPPELSTIQKVSNAVTPYLPSIPSISHNTAATIISVGAVFALQGGLMRNL